MANTNKLVAYDIKIDLDGLWYYRGAEMIRQDIINLFYRNLTKDEKGRYLVKCKNERLYVEVEDTPFVVKAVDRICIDSEEAFLLLMPDGSKEKLDPSTLRIGRNNALYCNMMASGFEARFSRPSHYELARYIEYDLKRDEYFLSLNGYNYYIKI